MTEKRFYIAESNLIDGYCVFDREKKYAFHPRSRKADCLNDAYILNELAEGNQQLKQYIKQVLQNHLDGWKGVYNPIDENEVIEINIVKSIAEDLGVDLK